MRSGAHRFVVLLEALPEVSLITASDVILLIVVVFIQTIEVVLCFFL